MAKRGSAVWARRAAERAAPLIKVVERAMTADTGMLTLRPVLLYYEGSVLGLVNPVTRTFWVTVLRSPHDEEYDLEMLIDGVPEGLQGRVVPGAVFTCSIVATDEGGDPLAPHAFVYDFDPEQLESGDLEAARSAALGAAETYLDEGEPLTELMRAARDLIDARTADWQDFAGEVEALDAALKKCEDKARSEGWSY